MEMDEWEELQRLLGKYAFDLQQDADGNWVMSQVIATFDGLSEVYDWIMNEFELK